MKSLSINKYKNFLINKFNKKGEIYIKPFKMSKRISIICCIIGLVLSLYGLTIGIQCINADGWDRIGVIFIPPSIIALIIIVFDFLITTDKIKKGLIYSCISSIIKISIIGCLIPSTIYSYKNEIEYGSSNLYFDLILIISLIIIAIPSTINIIKLIKLKTNN